MVTCVLVANIEYGLAGREGATNEDSKIAGWTLFISLNERKWNEGLGV